MRKRITRVNAVDGTFCRIEVELKEGRNNPAALRLSVCGTVGGLETGKYLRDNHRELITEYMMGSREQAHRPKRERRADIAAEMRDFDPLDHDCIGKVKVGRREYYLSLHGCGQITEELAAWFPEFQPLVLFAALLLVIALLASGSTEDRTCPDCGHVLGESWSYRALPPEIIAMVHAMPEDGFEVIHGKATRID